MNEKEIICIVDEIFLTDEFRSRVCYDTAIIKDYVLMSVGRLSKNNQTEEKIRDAIRNIIAIREERKKNIVLLN